MADRIVQLKGQEGNNIYPIIAGMLYPVGSIYMSVNNVNPSTLFGGTWEQIKDTFLLSAGNTYASGSTGGEVTHTLTTNEMPSHNHGEVSLSGGFVAYAWSTGFANGIVYAQDSNVNVQYTGGSDIGQATYGVNATHTHASNGGGQPHNNMPPYLAVYVWKRIA